MMAYYAHVYTHHVWHKRETESCANALGDELLKKTLAVAQRHFTTAGAMDKH